MESSTKADAIFQPVAVDTEEKTAISIVIPIYNEEGNVAKLHQEIKDVCESEGYIYEIIMVDDGSTDQTIQMAENLSPITLISLRKNFGQTAAMDAGIKQAQYDYIVTMDGDRQNDPADIPILVNHLEDHELDIVSGWRKNRQDPFGKRLISIGARLLRKWLINDGIHDSGCSLKVYRKECFEKLNLYGEMHRFIPAFLKIKGFSIGEITVNHRPRTWGKTKYNFKRTVKGFLDMLSVWFWNKYAVRPLHLLGGGGLLLMALGGLSGTYTLWLYCRGANLSETAVPLLSVFLLVTGMQIFVAGLIADMLSKTYYEKTVDTPYSIKKITKSNTKSVT
jgi:glycosyltransferase involved in cell wall biosynthesis